MSVRAEITTGMLAAVFGGVLLAANATGGGQASLDPKTAREIAVISRVIEKRLSRTRKTFAATLSPSPITGVADDAEVA